MKIIDAHIHAEFFSDLLRDGAKRSGVNYSLEGLMKEMRKNDVEYVVSIGLKSNSNLLDKEAQTPMRDMVCNKNMILVGGINPYKAEKEYNLFAVDFALKSGELKGLKVYLGYFDKHADDDVYKKYYELAAKHKVPVVFHTGYTFPKNEITKSAHPSTINKVAEKFSDTKFIIAHFGNPWVEEASDVMNRNKNVYADLSGLFEGDKKAIKDDANEEELEKIVKAYKKVDNQNKFIYGSDWPIVPMKLYIELIEKIIKKAVLPKHYDQHIRKVFRLNAKELFNIQ